MSGIFITFEGGEGCGKSTQLKRLADVLCERGHEVVKTREPGGTRLGRGLRELLLHNKPRQPRGPSRNDILQHSLFPGPAESNDLSKPTGTVPQAELLLMLADRAQHVQDLIRPNLDAGRIVLCDRYVDSTAAYQGYARGVDLVDIARLNAFVCAGCWPELTFVLDLPAEDGLRRAHRRRRRGRIDYFEAASVAFHERVREGFLAIARAEPERVCLIDAAQDIEAVHAAVLAGVRERLPVVIEG